MNCRSRSKRRLIEIESSEDSDVPEVNIYLGSLNLRNTQEAEQSEEVSQKNGQSEDEVLQEINKQSEDTEEFVSCPSSFPEDYNTCRTQP